MIFRKLLNNKVKEIAEQRKVLTETFPYTDWKKVPYTQYNKFLSLKDLIGECGVVWTNAFGRSNTEAEDTRKYLKDYSKHYEYVQDFQNLVFGNTVDTASSIISNSEIHIQKNDNTAGFTNTAFYLIKTDYNNLSWKFKITFDTTESIGVRVASSNGNFVYNQFYEQYGIKSGDIVTINSVPESNWSDSAPFISFFFTDIPATGINLIQIPNETANERDIELFNFGYSKQSGFNGYVQDFRNWNLSNNASGSKNEKGGTITNTSESSSLTTVLTISPSNYVNSEFIIEADFNTSANLIFYKANYNGSVLNIPLVKGKNTIRALTEEELAEVFIITLNISPGTTINITQIAPYQGAIVGDGIDDYGQCVKDFSLPEDYTVVAMREMLSNINGCTLAKMTSLQHGAFLFENQGYSTYSYGSNTRVTLPKLFSYQTKSSYNGTTISSGDASDSDTYKLKLFHQPAQNTYNQEALYSCGVFNRTLTAEELALVEDCMYLELEYNTNILDNIEYYDILDARYRSNEEAEERNKWNGRLGKLHLTLNNYAYSQMSGWNGSENLKNWNISGGMASILGEYVAHITKISLSAQIYRTAAAGDSVRMKFRLKGMQPGFRFSIIECKNGSSLREMTFATKDMTIDYSGTVSNADANQIAFFLHASGNVYDLSSNPVTIELIPDYGGALVSDGVDDYAISDEVIDEEIGGMVMMAEKISDPTTNYGNVFSSSTGLGTSSGKEIAGLISKGSDTVVLGDPWTSLSKNDSATYGFARSPLAPNNKLMIANNKGNERGNAALYQLRLLKTQPSDIQLEVIKQQVLREHNDYIKEMGWE